ncbi:hypothetical protein HKD37_15G043895 [Glycine soja]
MVVNAVVVISTSIAAEVDPTPLSGLNQMNHPTSDMIGHGGKELGSTGGPHYVKIQNKNSFPPYGLPPNYTPPNAAHAPDENVDNSAPIPVESQQPQVDHAHFSQPMRETHEVPHHNLANFEPRLGYAIEGQQLVVYPCQTLWRALNLVFADERIKVGLKRDKFDRPTLINEKPRANREDEKEEGTYVVIAIPTWPNFPPTQQSHYSANISHSHYSPPNHPQRSSLNQPLSLPVAYPMPNTTLNTNQNINQGRNFPAKKLVEFTPIPVSYANLLPYLVDNSIVAITSAKVPQPPFF